MAPRGPPEVLEKLRASQFASAAPVAGPLFPFRGHVMPPRPLEKRAAIQRGRGGGVYLYPVGGWVGSGDIRELMSLRSGDRLLSWGGELLFCIPVE